MNECMNKRTNERTNKRMKCSDLQGRQASLDDAGLAVLDDLVQGLKVLVPQGEDHPARVVVLPPQPHGLLTAGLHLSHTKPHLVQAIDPVL